MKTCEHFRPLLSRYAEGEANPGEALGIARHLAGCTACKIVLARELRLHEVLEGLDDPFSVDDEFSRVVMAALPAGPPPAAERKRRRGLRLAGLATLVSLGAAAAFRLVAFPSPSEPLRLASRLDLEGGSHLLEGLGQLAGGAAAVLSRVAVGSTARLFLSGADLRLGVAGFFAVAAVVAAGSVVAIATWTIGRRSHEAGLPAASGGERPDSPRH